MNALFGISMNVIMVVLLAGFALCMVTILGVFLSNRIMFRWGLRNVGRRRAQSVLVVAGLMLATVIITAAFSTGDAIDYSVTNVAYRNLQRTDLSIHHFRSVDTPPSDEDALKEQKYVPEEVASGLERIFQGDPDIEGFMPFLYEVVPVLNPRTRLAEPIVYFAGFDQERLDRFGGLRLANGDRADLAALGTDEVLIGESLAGDIDARKGDVIQVFAEGEPVDLRVAGIVKNERASGELEMEDPRQIPNMAARLETVQRIVGREGRINSINVALRGGVRGSLSRSDAAAETLETFASDEAAKAQAGLEGLAFQVEENKQDTVEEAEAVGSLFVTLFVVLGLFSIAAGAMLIFTLFVMLAAERRTEMGIARAVGAQRSNLIQAFLAEGVVYDLLAGVVGIALGVVAAFALVLLGVRFLIGEEMDFLAPHVAPRSLVVSFCLGAILTFLTVVISSYRVSYLNIVAAVRGQSAGNDHQPRRGKHWRWVVLGAPLLVVLPPLGIYWVFRKGLGMPWSRVLTPTCVILAILLIATGLSARLAFPWTAGVSVAIFAGALFALNAGINARAVWTTTGVILGIYWLAPYGWQDSFTGGKLGESVEMFVFAGIMIVTALTLVIVWNARLLTATLSPRRGNRYRSSLVPGLLGLVVLAAGVAMGDRMSGLGQLLYLVAFGFLVFFLAALVSARFPRFAPALKMGVAYPLASRFRTGMTIAMFSLVIFSITTMGIINASFLDMFAGDDGKAGWDVQVLTNPNNPVDDLVAELRDEGSFNTSAITATSKVTEFDDNSQEARKPGGEWDAYPIIAGDDQFYSVSATKLEGRATGFDTDREVFDAVRSTPNLAFIDASVMQPEGFGGKTGMYIEVEIKNHQFEPFPVEVRDPVSGRTQTVTVVGIFSGAVPTNILYGVYVNEATYRSLYGAPDYRIWYLRLAADTDAEASAKQIKAALLTRGVEATSIEEMIDDMLSTSRGFMRIMQAFMGLGLFVGIAALGVIALRSVVERRQQIGMLRAIGYQKGTVALSFLLESGFIALMGILSGVVGATIMSRNLLVSGEFSGASEIAFFVPWLEIIAYSGLSFAVALLMTWWPSRRASGVPVADALRYE